MKSSSSSPPLDLEHGIVTTDRDVEAARAAARHRPLSLDEYLEFLRSLPEPSAEELRRRPGPRGDEPFTL